VRTLYVQLEPMRQMAELLNESKAVALSQVTTLETQMEAIITRIQVIYCKLVFSLYFARILILKSNFSSQL
jgi:hypothetical protein